MTLATLFDFPFEDRRKLPHWSDMIMNQPGHGPVKSWEHKAQAMMECFMTFEGLWNERIQQAEPNTDLISMLVHHPETRNMSREQYHGTVVLLIVGGNDTTRNTISGSVYALNKFPEQYDKLRANPALVTPMVSETIRWQTPLAHMSRVATRDIEIGGKTIKKGERVVMWYISGNRDDSAIENPNAYIIDRARPRQHLSFGFGVHRCVGNRVAEMQLTIIWEEILKRFPVIKLVDRAGAHLLVVRARLREHAGGHSGACLTIARSSRTLIAWQTLQIDCASAQRHDDATPPRRVPRSSKPRMERFAQLGYSANLRDIAAEAGVDVALIKRYFGGKEALFTEALRASIHPDRVRAWDRGKFAAEVAQMMAGDAHDDEERTHGFQFLLRAATSPTTAPMLNLAVQERFLPADPRMAGRRRSPKSAPASSLRRSSVSWWNA